MNSFYKLFFFFYDYSVLCVLHVPKPTLTKALFEGGCLTPVPAELNDHRTKVEGQTGRLLKRKSQRGFIRKEKKGLPVCRLIK